MPNPRRRPPIRRYGPSGPAEAAAQESRGGPSLLPTILWAIGGLIGLGLLVLLLAVTLPHGFPARSERGFIGAVILLTVITLALGLKGLEAYLKWKEARAA